MVNDNIFFFAGKIFLVAKIESRDQVSTVVVLCRVKIFKFFEFIDYFFAQPPDKPSLRLWDGSKTSQRSLAKLPYFTLMGESG